MAMRCVWMDDWQMQCCGEPFAVGSTVTWTVRTDIDRDWYTRVLGAELAGTITDAEDHHGGDDELPEPTELRGTVRTITAVWCDWHNEGGDTLVAVPGSARLVERTSADGWEGESTDTTSFIGYLVDLDTIA